MGSTSFARIIIYIPIRIPFQRLLPGSLPTGVRWVHLPTMGSSEQFAESGQAGIAIIVATSILPGLVELALFLLDGHIAVIVS
ncbi:hypothetical protein [Tengunoibacter tsumagoiensis]|uniref:hypothetical protein n=1 Tax=Tengunoibacter tsumagoiensis TaxID=2014871 RepID=UPI000F8273C3|nr:hypothetical protein [Tengunoibacter tsumagoiensis]